MTEKEKDAETRRRGDAEKGNQSPGAGSQPPPPEKPPSPPPEKPPSPPPGKKRGIRVICDGFLGPKLLKRGDVTNDPAYVALLGDPRGLVEPVD